VRGWRPHLPGIPAACSASSGGRCVWSWASCESWSGQRGRRRCRDAGCSPRSSASSSGVSTRLADWTFRTGRPGRTLKEMWRKHWLCECITENTICEKTFLFVINASRNVFKLRDSLDWLRICLENNGNLRGFVLKF
jgi:hypothetical protein